MVPKQEVSSASSTNENADMISDKASDRICKHMNDDHPASVYGMALSTLTWNQERQGGEIKNCQLRSVSSEGYKISYVICNGDMCDMRDITVLFETPLKSSSEVRPRLIEIHHEVLLPKFSWLMSNSITFTAVLLFVMLSVGYSVIGEVNIPSFVEQLEYLVGLDTSAIIDPIFGSASSFGTVVKWSYYVTVIFHIIEALVAVYWCKKILKLKTKATAQWALIIYIAGWLIGYRLFKFVTLQKNKKKVKEDKSD
mmetsp:Transcript_10218/g.13335  ORF Transcript_10218/g.13335 Transcript_10218/m.13335 type:complete len:254 (+) Transcript_10218:14-775(+)